MYTDGINIKIDNQERIYKGLIDKQSNLPTQIGRVIRIDKGSFVDGQFENGLYHGFLRCIFDNNNWWDKLAKVNK